MNRDQALKQIWRETHRDFKGKIEGVKMVMLLRQGGSCLAPLDSLTDDEISSRVKGYKYV